MNFEKLGALAAKFQESPLPALTEGEAPTQYQSQVGTKMSPNLDSARQWVNWKKALTYFTLLNSPMPSAEVLVAYRTNLEQVTGDKYLSQEQFISVSLLFSILTLFVLGASLVRQIRRPPRHSSEDSVDRSSSPPGNYVRIRE